MGCLITAKLVVHILLHPSLVFRQSGILPAVAAHRASHNQTQCIISIIFSKNKNSSAGLSQYTVEQLELCSRRVHAVKLSSGPHCRASSHHIDHLVLDGAGATCTAIHCASNWLLRLSGKVKEKNLIPNGNDSDNISTIVLLLQVVLLLIVVDSRVCFTFYFLIFSVSESKEVNFF